MIEPIQSERLALRPLTPNDSEFVHGLANDPDWLRYIGDRGIHTLDDAVAYIRTGPVAMYETLGFGLLAVEVKGTNQPIGICGVLKRDWLPDPDLGFAFLPEARGMGYATESAAAVVAWAGEELGLGRLVAIVSADNAASRRLLEKIGFGLEGAVQPPGEEVGARAPEREGAGQGTGDTSEVLLYALRLTRRS